MPSVSKKISIGTIEAETTTEPLVSADNIEILNGTSWSIVQREVQTERDVAAPQLLCEFATITSEVSEFYEEHFHEGHDLGYYEEKEKREEEPAPPLREDLSSEEQKDFIIKFMVDATPQSLDRIFELVVADTLEVEASNPTPITPSGEEKPQWAKRKELGFEGSAVDWIKAHYGIARENGEWEPDGLSRAELRKQDRKLYQAYATRISRQPSEDLKLEAIEKKSFSSAEEELIHKRQVQRSAEQRYRKRQRSK